MKSAGGRQRRGEERRGSTVAATLRSPVSNEYLLGLRVK